MIRICDMLPAQADRKWQLAKQLGVRYAICKLHPDLTGRAAPDHLESLKLQQSAFADHGLQLVGLEGDQFDMSRIKQGLLGRDKDIDCYKRMLENMGRLGIKLLCYNFMVGMNWGRTDLNIKIRGDALASGFSLRKLNANNNVIEGVGHISADDIWNNYCYFIERVAPVAAEYGVAMGLHPDDPPVASMRGVGRIFGSIAGMDRAMGLYAGSTHGITFCQATLGLVTNDLLEPMRRWAEMGRIPFIHWRDVAGTAENFHEVFHDEGPTDMGALLQSYHDAGIDAYIRVDHVPAMAGEHVADSGLIQAGGKPSSNTMAVGYETMGRLFAIGYLKGLLEGRGIAFE
jgi:mannonate dehydratase